ncbi:MAG: hypothetical protein ACPGVU_00385 [Limisphaerales bacterium]
MKRVLFTAVLALATIASAAPSRPVIRTGERFPILELPRVSDAKLVSTSTTHGKKHIIHLFASW